MIQTFNYKKTKICVSASMTKEVPMLPEFVRYCNGATLSESTDAYQVEIIIKNKGKVIKDDPKISAMIAQCQKQISVRCLELENEENEEDMPELMLDFD